MDAIAENDAASCAAKPHTRSLRSRLYSNAAWSIGGRLISMAAVFAGNVFLARTLSTAEFSAYVVAAAASMFLAMPAALGVPRVILRLVREELAAGQPKVAIQCAWASIRLVAATSAVLTVIYLAGAQLLDDADKWRAVRDYSLLVASWFALSAICLSISHALQGFDDFRAAALTGAKNGGVLSNVLVVAALAVAAQRGQLSLRLAIIVQVVAQMLALAYACAALWRVSRRHRTNDGDLSPKPPATEVHSMLGLLRESWPILVIQLTSLGIAHVDVLLVSWLSEDPEIAAYAAVARLCELLGSAQILAVAIAAPFISELYVTNQLEKLERMLRGIASLTAIPTLIAATVLLVAPGEALALTYGREFVSGAAALRAGVLGCAVAVLSGTNSLVMIMTGQQRQLLRVSLVTSLLYLLVAPAMISAWSITGAAAATSIVFGAYNIVITLMVKSRIGVWTMASFSPSTYAFVLRRVAGHK